MPFLISFPALLSLNAQKLLGPFTLHERVARDESELLVHMGWNLKFKLIKLDCSLQLPVCHGDGQVTDVSSYLLVFVAVQHELAVERRAFQVPVVRAVSSSINLICVDCSVKP